MNPNRPRRIVFYGRVSTEHEQQLSALQNQMQWYDDQLKYHPNWQLENKYIDEGITGTAAKKRPAFLQMMEDAKNGEFDLIVTREVCRFARNTVDTLVYTRKFKNEYGIEVYFVEDNIWTMDGDGELRLTIMATLAQEESRKTSERVRAGQMVSRQNGVLYGNGNILGYNREGDTYIINEEQAETVRLIFDMYKRGFGLTKICRELTKMQRKDAQGNVKWVASKVGRILKRSTYKGVMAYNQSHVNNYLEQKRINNNDRDTYIYVKGDFPPIIPPEEWDLVQEILRSKTNMLSTRKIGKKPSQDIWLRKLKCICGSNYRKNKWRVNKDGRDCYGYQCYNQVNNGSKQFREKNGLDTEGFCDIKMIADWKLDLMAKEVIGSIWHDRTESVLEAYQLISRYIVEDNSEQQKKANELREGISKLKNKLENLIEMRTENEISKSEYMKMKTKFETQLSELRTELDVFKDEHKTPNEFKKELAEIKDILDNAIDFSQPTLENYIIDRFIYKVVPVSNDRFKWFVRLSDDSPIEEIFIGIEGRKNNPKVVLKKDDIHLATIQSNTGCYR